jgi:hypothetical protein
MTNPESLRLFFRVGVMISVLSLLLVFAQPRESAEFVISVCSLGIGLTLSALVVLVSCLGR